MGIRVIFFVLIIFLASCTSVHKKETPSEMSNGIKYSIAYCLSKTYPNSEFSSDSRHISGSYIQVGSYGIQVYESIRKFVNAYQQKKYVSKHNRNLNIMKCIDLLESNKLKVVIEQSANKKINSDHK